MRWGRAANILEFMEKKLEVVWDWPADLRKDRAARRFVERKLVGPTEAVEKVVSFLIR